MSDEPRNDVLVDGVWRVLALRANGIGDFLMVVPALWAVRRAYPSAEITVVGDAWLPEILERRPGPWDRWLVAPRYPGLRGEPLDVTPGPEASAFFEEQRARRYDIALQLHGGGATSNAFVARVGARVTAGSRATGAPPLDRWVRHVPHRHQVLRWLDVVALVGADALRRTADLVPRLTTTPADAAQARASLPVGGPFLALHVGARDHRRRWSTSRFVDLGRRLQADGATLVLVGGLADTDVSREVAEALGGVARGVHDLSGRLSLAGTLGVLEAATGFVGNDSGPRHLAIAVGTPTVGLFWWGNVLEFGPLVGDRHRAVVSAQVRCPVCGQDQLDTRCAHDVSFLDPITVAEVYETVRDVLSRAASDGSGMPPVTPRGRARP